MVSSRVEVVVDPLGSDDSGSDVAVQAASTRLAAASATVDRDVIGRRYKPAGCETRAEELLDTGFREARSAIRREARPLIGGVGPAVSLLAEVAGFEPARGINLNPLSRRAH